MVPLSWHKGPSHLHWQLPILALKNYMPFLPELLIFLNKFKIVICCYTRIIRLLCIFSENSVLAVRLVILGWFAFFHYYVPCACIWTFRTYLVPPMWLTLIADPYSDGRILFLLF